MKQTILLLFIFFGSYLSLQAQARLRLEPAQFQKSVRANLLDTQFEEVAKVTVENTTDQPLQIRWDQIVLESPDLWEISLCDDMSSRAPFLRNNSPGLIQVQPGESFDLLLTIKPRGQQGFSTIEVPLYLLTDPGKIIETALFQIEITDEQMPKPVSSRIAEPNDLAPGLVQLYPNPAIDRFYIKAGPNTTINRVEVRNMLGRTKKVFDQTVEGMAYNLGDLPEGIYLVVLFDTNEKVVRTMRLLKREYRP